MTVIQKVGFPMPKSWLAWKRIAAVLLLEPWLGKKGVAEQLSPRILIQQPYVILARLLDNMTRINKALYHSRRTSISSDIPREGQEHDQYHDTTWQLFEIVVEAGAQSVHVVGVGCASLEEAKL